MPRRRGSSEQTLLCPGHSLAQRARWNAEPFAYDWRKGIDTASDELARVIRARFPGQPVHIVAHSMGGLVARNMIRRHP